MVNNQNVTDYFFKNYDVSNGLYDKNKNNIVLIFDDNYFFQSLNLMESFLIHNQNIVFCCVTCDLSDLHCDLLLGKRFGVRLIKVNDVSSVIHKNGWWPHLALYKLFLPFIIEDVGKILYVDSDCLCTGNISSLFKLNVPLAMSPELAGMVFRKNKNIFDDCFKGCVYYNSGVVLINFREIKKHISLEVLNNILVNMKDYPTMDQDILNKFFHSIPDSVSLPIQYNVQPYEFDGGTFYKQMINNSNIIHFTGYKPWNRACCYKHILLYKKYSRDVSMRIIIRKVLIKKTLFLPFSSLKKLFSS